jgi:Nucleotidyl transferase AbiEii toxin, Type IV TA system
VGLPEGDSKERALVQLAELFEKHNVPYAIIGGVAIQIWTEEPRTTRDIDVALASYDDLPREALIGAGFKHEGAFEHSDNWRAPGPGSRRQRTVVQFSVDKLTPETVARAEVYDVLGGPRLLVASLPDLLRLKLEAALEPRHRQSKRTSDLADVQRLVEEHPDLAGGVPDLRVMLVLARVRVLMDEDARKRGKSMSQWSVSKAEARELARRDERTRRNG